MDAIAHLNEGVPVQVAFFGLLYFIVVISSGVAKKNEQTGRVREKVR
jgi:hypothetical protein